MNIYKITDFRRFKSSPFAATVLAAVDTKRWKFKSSRQDAVEGIGGGCVVEFVSHPINDKLLTVGAKQGLDGTIEVLTQQEKGNY